MYGVIVATYKKMKYSVINVKKREWNLNKMVKDNLEQTLQHLGTKTIQELETQRYNAQEMFYRAIVDPQETPEMRTKYLNAWKLCSDAYFSRKYVK